VDGFTPETIAVPAKEEAVALVGHPSSTALRVEGLTKTYSTKKVGVFSNVSFEIPRGQSVAIIGANGTGKSTLLRCCLRLIEPDSGQVSIHGREMMKMRGHSLRRSRSRVGFVFQKHYLVPRMTVLSNVMHGALARNLGVRAWVHGIAKNHERERALDCLNLVGLGDLSNRRADQLSGGQSQRVAIARSLMQDPELVFADEPVASLDPQSGEEIMNLFTDLNRKMGLTFVFVSHRLSHALNYSDRILGLRDGSLEIDANPASETEASLRSFYG